MPRALLRILFVLLLFEGTQECVDPTRCCLKYMISLHRRHYGRQVVFISASQSGALGLNLLCCAVDFLTSFHNFVLTTLNRPKEWILVCALWLASDQFRVYCLVCPLVRHLKCIVFCFCPVNTEIKSYYWTKSRINSAWCNCVCPVCEITSLVTSKADFLAVSRWEVCTVIAISDSHALYSTWGPAGFKNAQWELFVSCMSADFRKMFYYKHK